MAEYFSSSDSRKYPVICNIPHSSVAIPERFRGDFLLNDADLKNEAAYMADMYTDELFGESYARYGGIIARVSRIVSDAERFDDDTLEYMAAVGMGVLYEKTAAGETMRRLGAARREELQGLIYRPYHERLAELTQNSLDDFGRCLIVDCHSFPDLPRAYEPDQTPGRPDICIGSDSFHTPGNLVARLRDEFERAGFTVAVNSPFAGTMVPTVYYGTDRRVASVMIEVNRKLYMNDVDYLRKTSFSTVSEKICGLIGDLALRLDGVS